MTFSLLAIRLTVISVRFSIAALTKSMLPFACISGVSIFAMLSIVRSFPTDSKDKEINVITRSANSCPALVNSPANILKFSITERVIMLREFTALIKKSTPPFFLRISDTFLKVRRVCAVLNAPSISVIARSAKTPVNL